MPDPMICRTVSCAVCGHALSEKTAGGYDYEYMTSGQYFNFVRCNLCGHEYLNPQPTPDAIPLAYPDNYYTLEGRHTRQKAGLIGFLKRKITDRRLAYVAKRLPENASVLEIGCGDCSLLEEIRQRHNGWDVNGIDLNISSDSKKRAGRNRINILTANIETTELEEERYDLIIMNQLIEHLSDPAAILEKVSRALKKGGFLSIETPDTKGYDRSFFRSGFWGGYYFPRHLNLFDLAHLERLLNRNNLRVEKEYSLVAPIIWAFSWHAFLSSKAKSRQGKRLARFFFSDRNPVCLAIFTLTDLFAIRVGLRTSNQKIIARKT